jgi:hypothetical protein
MAGKVMRRNGQQSRCDADRAVYATLPVERQY